LKSREDEFVKMSILLLLYIVIGLMLSDNSNLVGVMELICTRYETNVLFLNK